MTITLTEAVNHADEVVSISKSSWIQYTAIGACALITLIIIIVVYDLCCRCQELKNQQIADGGPPASPSHQYIYKVGVRCDEASPTFDVKQSVIKVELLDNMNRYLTGVAVPTYLFNFKQDKTQSSSSSSQKLLKQQQQQQQPGKPPDPPGGAIQMQVIKSGVSQQQAAPAPAGANSEIPSKYNALTHVKSMTTMQEIWSSPPRASLVTFNLVRRQPLRNLTALRVSHDCFAPSAHIKLKYIIVHDPISKHGARVNLTDMPIRAHHPCPASGFQVFQTERISDQQQLEEMRSFTDTMKRRICSCCFI